MKSLVLCASLTLTACSDGRMGVDVSAQGAVGQLAYGAPTLAAAKRAFFGTDTGTGGGGGGGDLLSPDDPVTLHGLPPSVMQLALTRADDLGSVTLRSSAMLGYQHLRGTLPDGFGILTDPMQIDIWAQSLGLQMTLSQTRALPLGLHLDYAAGLGLTRLVAATHLQSALIDLRGRSLQVLPYAVIETRLAGQKGPALTGGLWVFQSGATELRLGVAQSF